MTANSLRGSAKIFQFPTGGRAAFGGRVYEVESGENIATLRVAKVASGDASYHEEAVQDAERARKN